MAMLTVRNLPDEVHRAIRVRAAQHGRSIEAEIRNILESAVKPQGRVKLGSLLAEIGREVNLTEEEFERIMNLPIVSHDVFGYDKISFFPRLWVRLYYIYLFKIAYPLGLKKKFKVT